MSVGVGSASAGVGSEGGAGDVGVYDDESGVGGNEVCGGDGSGEGGMGGLGITGVGGVCGGEVGGIGENTSLDVSRDARAQSHCAIRSGKCFFTVSCWKA